MRLAVQLGLVLILNKRSSRATQHFEFKHPLPQLSIECSNVGRWERSPIRPSVLEQRMMTTMVHGHLPVPATNKGRCRGEIRVSS